MAQLRAHMPPPLSALLLFGVDDTATSVLAPFYGGQTATPPSYAPGDMMEFSFDAAFFVFNLVANFAYTRCVAAWRRTLPPQPCPWQHAH